MVGCMGKTPQSIGASYDGWCPVCKTKGQTQALKTYRINFTQSIFLCTNAQCIYPLGYTSLDNIIANTADLKSSPNKLKKRNLTDPSLTCEKRQKIDPPICGDYPTVSADPCKSVSGFPPLDCESVSPTRLQHGQRECTDSQMPDISETCDVLSHSTLLDKSTFPILPTGYLSTHGPGQHDGGPAVLEKLQDVSQNGHLALMHILDNGSLLPTEINPVVDNVDDVQEKATESLKEEYLLNGLPFGSDPIPSCGSPPTPLLQNSQQECPIKENSVKEASLPTSNTGDNSDSRSDMAQSCEFLKDDLSLIEPLKEQIANIDNLTVEGNMRAALCNKEATLLIRHSYIEISGNKDSPELQPDESDQPLNLSIETSHPTCPDDAEQVNSFGSADLSGSVQLMQESGDKLAVSNSLENVLQESPAEDCSSTNSWKPVSSPCLVVKDRERSCPALSSGESEGSLPEGMSMDNLNMPIDLTSPSPHRSRVRTEDPPIPNLSLLQDLVQSCQKTNSEEHRDSNISQDILPESRVDESTLNASDSPITSVPSAEDQAYADAAAISLPDNYKKDTATPSDSLGDNRSVCQHDDYSEKVCEPQGTSASIMKDDCNEHIDATRALNKIPSPGPQILLQDCLKCHFGTNMSSQSVQKNTCNDPTTVNDQVYADPSAASSANAHTDAKPLDKISLPGPQILLQDYLKCHCGMNTSSRTLQNMQTVDTNSVSEVCSPLCLVKDISESMKVSTQSDSHKDSNTVSHLENQTTISPIDCKSPSPKQKKAFYESTMLPDLLLDIQPEHRMEEALSACPSPQSDSAVSMTLTLDMEVLKQDAWQKVKECESTVEPEPMEELIDHSQDGSKLADTLEISLNDDYLTDANEAMETQCEDSAQVSESPARKKLTTERHLQWKNKYALCWLDCILSAMVLSETVNDFVANNHLGKESIVHNLFTRYNEATTMYINSLDKQKSGKRADHRRPKYDKCLHEVRMEIFEKLQPLLHCTLGKRDSPVFAFPLLLGLDPETENLYMHTFMWQFKCEACGYSYQQRCQKTLTTFTEVLPEWHPLNAVHRGPCNQCQDTEQKRSMVLEKLNEIFMVHFVGGLPHNELNKYSFQFKGHFYEVKAIVKFRNKHFSTWISKTDGTWLESDDLRGSFCRRYQKFSVRADDIHIVIWERSNGKTLPENVQLDTVEQNSEYNPIKLSMTSQDQTPASMGAAELSQQVAPIVPSVALNASDPLAGMEGYTDDDVITLTLVEVPLDANGRPVETVPTCTPLKEANQKESTHTVQPKSQEDYTFASSISSDSNAEPVPLRDCSLVLGPSKQAGEAFVTSTPNQEPCNTKTSIAGNWMTRLISKNKTILNSDPLANKNILGLQACSPLKETDVSGVPKKAQNYNGFQGRNTGKTGLLESHIFPLNIASKPHFSPPKEKGAPIAKPLSAPSASGFRMPGSKSLDYGKLLKEGGSSSDDKIRKLRLKLLKKLKVKKNELATLEKLTKKQQSSPLGEQASGGPQGGFNRKQHLRGIWQELQEHIDNADNESVCTMSSSTSICSSPGDAEFFSELFSPSPGSQPSDSNYLEMLADGCGIATAGQSQQANGHQGEGGALQSTYRSNACSTSTTQNGSSTDESLNLMSSSTLTVLNEDNSYFNFDDFF